MPGIGTKETIYYEMRRGKVKKVADRLVTLLLQSRQQTVLNNCRIGSYFLFSFRSSPRQISIVGKI